MDNIIKKAVLTLVITALSLLITAQLLKPQIAAFIFSRALEQNLGRDISTDLPDGLHVFICGAGGPLPDMRRSGPCTGIIAGDKSYLFDAGAGNVRNLMLMGFPFHKLEAIYLTHLHSDHIDGLGQLMIQTWIAGQRKTPIIIYGPRGVTKVVNGFNTAYEIDAGFRTAHHGHGIAPPEGAGGVAVPIETPTKQSDTAAATLLPVSQAALSLQAILVSHEPVEPAFGYRLDYKNRSVVISGDTKFDNNLLVVSQNADLLIHEVLDPEMILQMADVLDAKGLNHLGKVFRDVPDYHTTPEETARIAADANVEELLMHHIVPPLPSDLLETLFLGQANEIYDGKITIAKDGMILSLPAGTDVINHRSGL
ncbi:hypothetical protein IMCC14465_05800 [alpha proteobacterium IMCC14465]|uniref:Metallo-beta-lactamase domain-containing protein n=1 Tax=alpha proteobacterium IMCC14465 TaxID=1220535 RepID=J9DYP6_9PROT|nr:hypothetical protein IMCC14465_05800 [alpha proteobacterium IMCC14465]